MNTGLLWFDNSQDPFAIKLQKAVDYYKKKYGRLPDLCLVHPKMLDGQDVNIEGLTVRPYRPVLPGHIWIGIEEMPLSRRQLHTPVADTVEDESENREELRPSAVTQVHSVRMPARVGAQSFE